MQRAVRPMRTFGDAWSLALCIGCASLNVPPEWVLAVLALESGFDPLARNSSGARGLWQRMPIDGKPYDVADPVKQIEDAFGFWRAMVRGFRAPLRSREAVYCLNLAPARLRDGQYDDETVLYGAPSMAYKQNAKAFGLDPEDPVGRIRMRNLAHGIDAAIARHRARYDAELAAAYAVNASGGGPPEEAA